MCPRTHRYIVIRTRPTRVTPLTKCNITREMDKKKAHVFVIVNKCYVFFYFFCLFVPRKVDRSQKAAVAFVTTVKRLKRYCGVRLRIMLGIIRYTHYYTYYTGCLSEIYTIFHLHMHIFKTLVFKHYEQMFKRGVIFFMYVILF